MRPTPRRGLGSPISRCRSRASTPRSASCGVRARRFEDGAERLQIAATTFGIAFPFDVRLEDGFCLMQARARLYLVVMAAEPLDDGERTRFFHLEAIPLPGTAVLRRILQREVDADFRHLARIAARGF